MNFKLIFNKIGNILQIEGILMLIPLIIGLIYKENFYTTILAFLICSFSTFLIGSLLNIKKATNTKILPKSSLIIVAFSWIMLSLFGCLPLVISKEYPSFFDAFFEMCSGFSTTGASTMDNVEGLSKSILLWRSLSHWIGGMGVIVFILAILPDSKDGSNMHILRAESPGPQVGKLTSKISTTARILYLIYITLTIILFLLLWLGPDKNMDAFSSLCITLGTAGTGGFAITNAGISSYGIYSQYVIAIFMFLFGINFTNFYLIAIKKYKDVFKNEELRLYIILVFLSTMIIFINLLINCASIYSPEEAFRAAFFQVSSIISTTGYGTTDYEVLWPSLSKSILVFLMLTGPCAGSTGGGVKLQRINILFKNIIRKIKIMISPHRIEIIKQDEQILDEETSNDALVFFSLYIFLLIGATLIISIDGYDFATNFTASLSCISNIGPGLGKVGPCGNFKMFSNFSKLVLSFLMITGRLELFPMICLFNPRTWKKR